MDKVDAVVIGGGTIHDAGLRSVSGGIECKSLIVLNGKPMIQWVVEALKASRSIGRVIVVGPAALSEMQVAQMADEMLPEGDHEVVNLMKGMDALPDSDRILMVTGDMPLLIPAALDDFVENAPDADIIYPTITKESVLAEFPDRKWVFVKVTEGEITGSSAFMFRPHILRHHEETLRKVFDSRRSVTALVKMWGVGFALKFALGRLSLKDVEARISEVLDVSARAYISRYPELAFDVDHASDIAIAEGELTRRQS